MPRLFLLAVVACAAACPTVAQPATAEAAPEATPGTGVRVPFRPSIAIVVGIFTMIFSLTFLLLMYAKFCHSSPAGMRTAPENNNLAGGEAPGTGENDGGDRASGVVKAVVESLPFFRFAALRGARRGLECAVCLSRFDDADLLRLLPRCRHAFHLDCVDRWLESHASCPLCRTRVDADDATIGLKYSASARFLFGASDRFDESDRAASAPPGRDILDLFIERVPSSRLDAEAAAKAANGGGEESGPELLDRHKHRIVVSDFVFKNRWSDLNSADLIALDREMLRSLSSGRFASPFSASPEHAKVEHKGEEDSVVITIKEEMEKKRLLESKAGVMNGATEGSSSSSAAPTARMVSGGARSMSEIVNLPRLRAAVRERLTEEERARRLWLPIARRTARWFAGRDRRYVREDVVTSDPCKDEVTDVAAHV